MIKWLHNIKQQQERLKMNKITDQNKIREMILSSKGKIFSVHFVKKNGEERTMVVRLGVKKHLKGGDSTTAHIPNLVTGFDMVKKAYRCINLETIRWIKVNGEVTETDLALKVG